MLPGPRLEIRDPTRSDQPSDGPFAQSITAGLQTGLDGLKNGLVGVKDGLVGVTDTLGGGVKEGIGGVKVSLVGVFKEVGEKLQTVQNSFTPKSQLARDHQSGGFSTGAPNQGDAMPENGFISSVLDTVLDKKKTPEAYGSQGRRVSLPVTARTEKLVSNSQRRTVLHIRPTELCEWLRLGCDSLDGGRWVTFGFYLR